MTGLSDELNRLNTEGWSTREIERVAERHGHKLHYSTVSNYMAGRHAAPTGRVLEAFAAVFGVSVNNLRRAADMPSVGEPLDLGAESGRLTGPQREAVRHVARVMLEQNDEVARAPERDGATATEARVRAYLEQHLLTEGRWPDFPLLPRDKREEALAIFVRYGAELIESGLVSESMALPTVVEQAQELIEREALAAVPASDRDDLADPAVPDGATTDSSARAKARRAKWDRHRKAAFDARAPRQEDFGRAAMAGHSELEQDDAAADRRGEGSQDPEDWT